MITHHPSLIRPSVLTLRADVLRRRPTLHAVASAPPPRLWSLRATTGGTSPVSGDGGKRAVPLPTRGPALLGFVRSNFLPLALIGGIILGLLDPTLGCLAHKYSLSKYSTFGIFVISGLTLRTRELGAALEAWPAGLYGLGSILLFTPFLAQFIMQVQFFPPEFITGLAMFCCMPTTLSSGVTLTQLVGGNSALALAMTVASNLLGIIICWRGGLYRLQPPRDGGGAAHARAEGRRYLFLLQNTLAMVLGFPCLLSNYSKVLSPAF
uniref:Sodium/metabolite cotransporter BASS4 chloroplastic n=1 Tax=Zea mays TaxID=4577 RepID=A0A804PIT7_MAIZE